MRSALAWRQGLSGCWTGRTVAVQCSAVQACCATFDRVEKEWPWPAEAAAACPAAGHMRSLCSGLLLRRRNMCMYEVQFVRRGLDVLLLCARGYWLGRRTGSFFLLGLLWGKTRCCFGGVVTLVRPFDLHVTNHERPGDTFVAGEAETAIAEPSALRGAVVWYYLPLFRSFPLAELEPCTC